MGKKSRDYFRQTSVVGPYIKNKRLAAEQTRPLIPLRNIDSNPKSQSAREAKVPAYKSNFTTLNHFPLAREQEVTSELAVEKMRHKLLSYENLRLNLKWRKQRIHEYLVEVHKKISIPFGCIIFMLIGAPLGMLTRKGNLGYAALISAVIFTFYWTSLIEGEKLADRMLISPFTSMWAGNIMLTIIGILLTIKIWRDHLIVRKKTNIIPSDTKSDR